MRIQEGVLLPRKETKMSGCYARTKTKSKQGVMARKNPKYHDRLYRSRGMNKEGSGSIERSIRETTKMEEGVRT